MTREQRMDEMNKVPKWYWKTYWRKVKKVYENEGLKMANRKECVGCTHQVIIDVKDINGKPFQMYDCECETKMCGSCIPTYDEE